MVDREKTKITSEEDINSTMPLKEPGRIYLEKLKDDLLRSARDASELHPKDPRKPTDKFIKKLANLSGVDWRTLKTFITGRKSISKDTYEKLVNTFEYVRMNMFTGPLDFYESVADQDVSHLIFEMSWPKGKEVTPYKAKLAQCVKEILETTRNFKRELPTHDEVELLNHHEKCQKRSKALYKDWKKKELYIFTGKNPIYMQPPIELLPDEWHHKPARVIFYLVSAAKVNVQSMTPNWSKMKEL